MCRNVAGTPSEGNNHKREFNIKKAAKTKYYNNIFLYMHVCNSNVMPMFLILSVFLHPFIALYPHSSACMLLSCLLVSTHDSLPKPMLRKLWISINSYISLYFTFKVPVYYTTNTVDITIFNFKIPKYFVRMFNLSFISTFGRINLIVIITWMIIKSYLEDISNLMWMPYSNIARWRS